MAFNPYAINQVFITTDDKTFDVSDLVDGIQYSTVLEGQPSKLTFTLQKDPNGKLSVHNGSTVQFRRDGKGIFFGYVFDMGTDATETYKITAYDQMRYLKNETTTYLSGMKVSEVFNKLCNENGLRKFTVVTPCDFICPDKIYEGQTLFSILKDQITRANIASNGKKYYFIRDNFGTLELNEIGNCKTDLVIGDKSLLSSYQFSISIDKNTYNRFLLVKKDGNSNSLMKYVVEDSGTQKLWGMLQKVINVDENNNKEQMTEIGKQNLTRYNRESRSFKLSALGDDSIFAGSGISVNIPQLRTVKIVDNKETNEFLDMWVVGCTHNFNKDMHTMELDIAIP